MEKISYKLEVFEGPLDLLLNLIQKNKLNIYDIPITELLDQYMEHIHAMQKLDMDIASEFLDMAARLVYIKTVSLLPKHENEDEEDPRKILSGELLEYRECRRAAKNMEEQITFDRLSRKPLEMEADLTYRRHHSVQELLKAYLDARGRGKRFLPPSAESFSGIVAHKFVSVTSQIPYVLRKLLKRGEIEYIHLFEEKKEKSDLVAAFLAVLELVRNKCIRVDGSGSKAKVTLLERGRESWNSKDLKEP